MTKGYAGVRSCATNMLKIKSRDNVLCSDEDFLDVLVAAAIAVSRISMVYGLCAGTMLMRIR